MSNSNTVDDLLSFKEYEPDNYSRGAGGRAEININSPKRDFGSHFDDSSSMADEMSISIDEARPGRSGGSGNMEQQHQQASGSKYNSW